MQPKVARFCLIFALFSAFCSMPTAKTLQARAAAYPSKAECVIDAESRRILYAYSSDKPLPIASTTKILTATTVLEKTANSDQEIVIPNAAVGIEGSSVYLKAGDRYTVKDLLYGLLLRSGNDCATALALTVAPSVSEFAVMMNQTAQQCGALHGNFVNPHGLHHEKHYSTAKDLCYITATALKYPLFREIIATKRYEKCGWTNKNRLLTQYEGCLGGKTGFTKKAGKCLVSVAERESKEGKMTLICSVLSCPSTYERTKTLFNDAFERYERTKLLSKDDVIETSQGRTNPAEEFYYPLLKEESGLIRRVVKEYKTVKNGKILGQMQIWLANHLIFSTNLYKL